jgi:hypothetical protein
VRSSPSTAWLSARVVGRTRTQDQSLVCKRGQTRRLVAWGSSEKKAGTGTWVPALVQRDVTKVQGIFQCLTCSVGRNRPLPQCLLVQPRRRTLHQTPPWLAALPLATNSPCSLFARHRTLVYRWLLRFVGNETNAEDRRYSISTWLISIARFKAQFDVEVDCDAGGGAASSRLRCAAASGHSLRCRVIVAAKNGRARWRGWRKVRLRGSSRRQPTEAQGKPRRQAGFTTFVSVFRSILHPSAIMQRKMF